MLSMELDLQPRRDSVPGEDSRYSPPTPVTRHASSLLCSSTRPCFLKNSARFAREPGLRRALRKGVPVPRRDVGRDCRNSLNSAVKQPSSRRHGRSSLIERLQSTRHLICSLSPGVPVLNAIAASRLARRVTPAAGSEPACKEDLPLARRLADVWSTGNVPTRRH
ncbi:hypothetical protein VTN77DRAFT_9346 [Rasamsonia byssochlamydoides]|uniref:uncharacterized protein n=1 Tax=Rasamsonia byssochlamydoides TaxID=89139 RepID=UPI00374435EF